jgi:hypothetical protein
MGYKSKRCVGLVTIPFYDEASSSIEELASSFRTDGRQSSDELTLANLR